MILILSQTWSSAHIAIGELLWTKMSHFCSATASFETELAKSQWPGNDTIHEQTWFTEIVPDTGYVVEVTWLKWLPRSSILKQALPNQIQVHNLTFLGSHHKQLGLNK